MPFLSQNSGSGAGSRADGSTAFNEDTSRSSRNTCPLNTRVQHFAHDVHLNPTSLITSARRSTGYSRSLLRSCVSATIRKGIEVREKGISSRLSVTVMAQFIVFAGLYCPVVYLTMYLIFSITWRACIQVNPLNNTWTELFHGSKLILRKSGRILSFLFSHISLKSCPAFLDSLVSFSDVQATNNIKRKDARRLIIF